MSRIRVLSPAGASLAETLAIPALPPALDDRTVGFLDNTKSNFDRLAATMGDLLRERHGIRLVVHRRKANASTPAPPEVIAELAKTCDLVFAGSADGGSCTSWSLHDAIEVAKLGTPAGVITTTAFQRLAVNQLAARGIGALPLLVIEHPLGGERPEAVARRGQQAMEQLASLLGGRQA
jgi:hypothetical protein